MKQPRYLAVVGQRDSLGARLLLETRALEAGLSLVCRADGLSVFSDQPSSIAFASAAGVVLGRIYRTSPGMPDFHPTVLEHAAIIDTRGTFLGANCWGDYVAFLSGYGRDGPAILRAPFADLACLHTHCQGLQLVASDMALLRDVSRASFQTDDAAVARHLLTSGLRVPETCLQTVRDLLWGSRTILREDRLVTDDFWSPWDHVAKPIEADVDELAGRLREVTAAVVEAQLRPVENVAVMLSGGLDSSLLAQSIARCGVRTNCITLTTGDKVGDERSYAGIVAHALRLPLYSASHDLDQVDIFRSQAAHLARPIARSFAQATRAAKQDIARRVGAQAILDGGGGDNIFCSLQSAAPVVDRIRREGPGRGALKTARDIALMTQASLGKVLAKTAQRLIVRGAAYRWICDERFMSANALECAGRADHRWLHPPAGALPGSAAHIAVIAAVENLLETSDAGIPERAPLMAQPLVELCLSIPSWLWFGSGHNRVIARRALLQTLPPEIAWRRSKGTPDGFVARVFEANRSRLRKLLCDGQLVNAGLIDADAIAHALAEPGPVKGNDYIRVLRIADVEAWLRCV